MVVPFVLIVAVIAVGLLLVCRRWGTEQACTAGLLVIAGFLLLHVLVTMFDMLMKVLR